MPHYLYCRHRFPRGARCRLGSSAFLKLLSDAAHPHSPSRVAVPHDAPRGPRGARPGAATGGGASAGGGARAHRIDRCATRSASNTCRIPLHVGVREKRPRSRGRVRTPRVRGTARPRHTRRDEARGIERTRAVACASRGVGDRNGPSRAASIVPPRRARLERRNRRNRRNRLRDGFDERSARVRGRIVPCRSVRAASEARRAERSA